MAVDQRKVDRNSENYSGNEAAEGAYFRVVSGADGTRDIHDTDFGGSRGVTPGMFRKKVADVAFKELEKFSGENKDEVLKFVGLDRLVNAQYNGSIENLKRGGLYNPEKDKNVPSMAEAMQFLKEKLTFGQLEVIAGMQNPVFIMKPKTTYKRFEDNLKNISKVKHNSRREEWEERERESGVNETIAGWEIGLAEGAELVDGKAGKLGFLNETWESSDLAQKGAKLLTHNEYMLLLMDAIRNGRKMDERSWSVLRGEGDAGVVGKDGRVSGGYLDKDGFGFRKYDPVNYFRDANFRYGVMVDAA